MQIIKMEKFFSVFGKTMSILVILAVFVYGGYYFGTQAKQIKKPGAVNTEVKVVETTVPVATSSSNVLTTISAGVSKSAGLSFDQYSVLIPEGWTSKKESQTALDEKLILEKSLPAGEAGVYSISIFQAATGGALCLYPGDADFEGPSSKYAVFTNLTTKDGRNLRRSLPAQASGNQNGTTFTVCQKAADGSFQQPTNYGHISVKLPDVWTKEVLTEIDTIISSLKKI